jgi:hypothetical protein
MIINQKVKENKNPCMANMTFFIESWSTNKNFQISIYLILIEFNFMFIELFDEVKMKTTYEISAIQQ